MTLTSLFAAFQQSRRRRAAIRDLKRLSDEQLLDLGIEPDRVEDIAGSMLWSEHTGWVAPRPANSSERQFASDSRWRMV